ncbi:MAG: Gfo/Idh/MocA family protein [Armatimonadota bacterium]
MSSPLNRRRFLKSAAGTGAGLLIVPARTAFTYQANERLNLALVGVGGYACAAHFVPALHLYENVGVAAICDVDDRKLAPHLKLWEERAREWPASAEEKERKGAEVYQRVSAAATRPPLFRDFREMLERKDREIDAVVCSTPDHTHAVVSAASLRAGKHILAEKPLTITVHEARALRRLAGERKLATSMGNQGTQSGQFRRGVELIREGILGPVEEVHVWYARGGVAHRQQPAGEEPVPPELHWDLWLGPAAWRPYHSRWIARNHWRETGIGELGNFGPHTLNLAFMGLNIADLWQPGSQPRIRVEAEAAEINPLSFPRWETIRWKVPARGQQPPVTITWHHGPEPKFAPGDREMLRQRVLDLGGTAEQADSLERGTGCLVIGSKGALLTDSHNTRFALLPAERFQDVEQQSPRTLPSSRGHYRDWLHACRGGEMPLASFDYAATFSEFLALGSVSTRFEGELEYDPVPGRVTHRADANQALGYEYRSGWRL